MQKPLILLLLCLFAGMPTLLGAQDFAETPVGIKRVALVIGNSSYLHAPVLSNPKNDAKLIANTLTSLGFELVGGDVQLDLDKRQLDHAVQTFGKSLGTGVVAVVYYAGHGVEIEGSNYLMPIDADPDKPSDFDLQALNASLLLRQMRDAGTNLNVVILDACRNNPFEGKNKRLRGGIAGLAAMEAPEGTLIAYAAEAGKKAQDGPADGNSPYASALALSMKRGMGLWDTFNEVALQVAANTKKQQIPWVSNSPINGQFYFSPTKIPIPSDQNAPSASALELEFWQSIKDSVNPADFQAYLDKYPNGQFTALVRNRLTPVTSVARTCSYCPEMVAIPGGEFYMGSDSSDPKAKGDEKPRHPVQVAAFSLGKYEVTRGQFAAFVKETSYNAGSGCWVWDGKWVEKSGYNWQSPSYGQSETHPVACVSAADVDAYSRWLSQKTGNRYRLPTEAEWEYAARAGSRSIRYWGDAAHKACSYANVADQTQKKAGFTGGDFFDCSDGYVYTAPVGSFLANAWGLQDMQGNVWEWTCSAYTPQGYDGSEKKCNDNPKYRRLSGRGGSWSLSPPYQRSADRRMSDPSLRNSALGFRLVQVN